MQQDISPRKNLCSPTDSEYLAFCSGVRTAIIELFKYALSSATAPQRVEVCMSREFMEEATKGPTRALNSAISKWYIGYRERMAEVGLIFIPEEQLTFELTAIVREVFPRATAEASPGLLKKMDIFIPNLKHNLAIMIEIGFYFGKRLEKIYFSRDAMNKGRKLDQAQMKKSSPWGGIQVYDYFQILNTNRNSRGKFSKFACVAVILAANDEGATAMDEHQAMSLIRIFNEQSISPKVQPHFSDQRK
uniref:Uncharacterized protein n=1 Tax=Ditylenchus dipsaci TaxID=166011 RepID=A0A915DRC4_9BILA